MSKGKTHRRRNIRSLNYKQIIRDIIKSFLSEEQISRRITISRICLQDGDTFGNVVFLADEEKYLTSMCEKYVKSSQSQLVDLGDPHYDVEVNEHTMIADLIFKKRILANYYQEDDYSSGEETPERKRGSKGGGRRKNNRKRRRRRRKKPGIALKWKIIFSCIFIFLFLRWLKH